MLSIPKDQTKEENFTIDKYKFQIIEVTRLVYIFDYIYKESDEDLKMTRETRDYDEYPNRLDINPTIEEQS
jgi:hypothetical protein